MKVAIVGGGPGGLACALECEKLGLQAELYERNVNVGWAWPSMSIWPTSLYNHMGDPREYIKSTYKIDFTPLHETKTFVIKSPKKQVVINGNLGLTFARGKADESIENQLLLQLNKTPIFYNSLVNYKELAQKYDYVVVASGRETEARDMGLWEDKGVITIVGATAIGSFDTYTSSVYFNTEYAGTGYGRLTSYNKNSALIDLYIIGKPETQALELFEKFKQMENLSSLDFVYKNIPPPFTNGKVKKFQKGNVLLVGKSAGLTDRLLGVGSVEALITGTLAARAIAEHKDYDSMVRPLQTHIENVSAFRNAMNNFNNNDFDNLVSILGTPGIKQLIYNTKINFAGMVGDLFKLFLNDK